MIRFPCLILKGEIFVVPIWGGKNMALAQGVIFKVVALRRNVDEAGGK